MEVSGSSSSAKKPLVVSPMHAVPLHLLQPAPRDEVIQCEMKWNRENSTFYLFSHFNTEKQKFILAARKIRHLNGAEFIISSDPDDLSQNGVGYMGKLRGNFLGNKFVIYDNQPPYSGAMTATGSSRWRFCSEKRLPKVPYRSSSIAEIAYEIKPVGKSSPRHLQCTMHSIPASALEPNGTVPSYYSGISLPRAPDNIAGDSESAGSSRFSSRDDPLVLENKPPNWHEHLQCWTLNFHGRSTIASVKSFQLIAAPQGRADNSGLGTSQDPEEIILMFGKFRGNMFSVDYRYPLSAFQAFGICLSSMGTKPFC